MEKREKETEKNFSPDSDSKRFAGQDKQQYGGGSNLSDKSSRSEDDMEDKEDELDTDVPRRQEPSTARKDAQIPKQR